MAEHPHQVTAPRGTDEVCLRGRGDHVAGTLPAVLDEVAGLRRGEALSR